MADGILLAVTHCSIPHLRSPACRNFPDNSLDSIANLHQLQSLELSGVGFTESASKPSVRNTVRETSISACADLCSWSWSVCPSSLGCVTS
jgi:hypothetical protein